MGTVTFTESDRLTLLSYLQTKLKNTDLVPELFLNNLMETAQDPEFATVIRQWLFDKTVDYIQNITVHNYDLRSMAKEYDDTRFGVLFSLIPLYLEKTRPETYRDICGFAGVRFYADHEAIEAGDFITEADLGDDGYFYLFGEHTGTLEWEDRKRFWAYDAWGLLIDYPELIEPLSSDYKAGTQIVMDPDSMQYTTIYPPDDERG